MRTTVIFIIIITASAAAFSVAQMLIIKSGERLRDHVIDQQIEHARYMDATRRAENMGQLAR
jgi:hypothetical protein